MMKRNLQKIPPENKTAFTMVEVIVSTLIFMLLAGGMFATISALSRPAGTSTREMTAALVARGLLENLRMNIDATTWNAAGTTFAVGNHSLTKVTINGIDYTPCYSVTADPGGSAGRVVNLTINWEE
jgi:Tfp pilus assembly protein PilV